jgi:hypothetical protein
VSIGICVPKNIPVMVAKININDDPLKDDVRESEYLDKLPDWYKDHKTLIGP